MALNFGSDNKSALQAKYDAQKIAFAPIMFQAAKALRDFGILELLKKGRKDGLTKEDILKGVNLSEYSVTVLLEAGLSIEMIHIRNDRYILTKTGFYILSDPLTNVNMNFANDVNYLAAFYLQDALKSGKPEGLHKVFGNWSTLYEALPHLPQEARDSWFAFDHYYSNIAFTEILPVIFRNKPLKVLDLGGNTGKFAIACAKHTGDVRILILDLPGQLDTARQNIGENGFNNRIDLAPINFLDKKIPFPKGFDVIVMSQFLDCFSEDEVVSILQRAKDAMGPDSELFILEPFWDNQKHEASRYCLHATSLYFTCMANGNSRMYHSGDMKKLVHKAGLSVVEEFKDIGVSHTLLRCRIT